MKKPSSNKRLEQQFLDELIGSDVKVFVLSGRGLSGTLRAHDEDVLVLDWNGVRSLTYKLQVSTVLRNVEGN